MFIYLRRYSFNAGNIKASSDARKAHLWVYFNRKYGVVNMSLKIFLSNSSKLIILPVILIWPILRWAIALDVFFQFLLIFLNWHGPNTKSIIIFILHFSVLTAVTFIVSSSHIYKDKEKFWPPSLQLMAKDILWFHALVWEGLLAAENISFPGK